MAVGRGVLLTLKFTTQQPGSAWEEHAVAMQQKGRNLSLFLRI